MPSLLGVYASCAQLDIDIPQQLILFDLHKLVEGQVKKRSKEVTIRTSHVSQLLSKP